MKLRSRRYHDHEFKRIAVQASIDSFDSVAAVAAKYAIHPALLSRWRTEFVRMSEQSDDTSPSVSNKGPEKSRLQYEREAKRLKKRIKRLELENDILKKAEEYFTKNQE